jgi:hypothetical protein
MLPQGTLGGLVPQTVCQRREVMRRALALTNSIQIKNLKIEAEKGFRRTLFEPELVDPNMEINFVKSSMAAMHFQH